mmetsp:Transcript_56355/g.89305  ORF Transcript_56355/g.89305 Transcript_56355/m.89305 type:complete len:89 (-) Transcript_56355:210-476(-)
MEEKSSKSSGSKPAKEHKSGIASGTTSVGAGEHPARWQLTAKLRRGLGPNIHLPVDNEEEWQRLLLNIRRLEQLPDCEIGRCRNKGRQ